MKISLFSLSLNTQGKFLKAKFFVLLSDASVLHIHSGEKILSSTSVLEFSTICIAFVMGWAGQTIHSTLK